MAATVTVTGAGTFTSTGTCPCCVQCNDCTACGGTCDDSLTAVTVDLSQLIGVCTLCGTPPDSVTLMRLSTCRWYHIDDPPDVTGDDAWEVNLEFNVSSGCYLLTITCYDASGENETVTWSGCKGGDSPVGTYSIICSQTCNSDVLTLEVS